MRGTQQADSFGNVTDCVCLSVSHQFEYRNYSRIYPMCYRYPYLIRPGSALLQSVLLQGTVSDSSGFATTWDYCSYMITSHCCC
jgi:hypothetical protein